MRKIPHIPNIPHILGLVLALALVGAACGSDSGGSAGAGSDSTAPDSADETPAVAGVVFVWTETGGCAAGGPNCARYEVEADGTVSTYRDNGDDDEVAASGTVDQALVDAWLTEVEATNVEELISRLGPGEMTAAFDGVDYELEAPHASLNLSSVDVEFDEAEALFVAATKLAEAAYAAAPLEIEMR